jgi:hypothetical protein
MKGLSIVIDRQEQESPRYLCIFTLATLRRFRLNAGCLLPRHMSIAAGKPGRVELVADGNETVLLRDNEMSLLVGERTFKITRKGFLGPKYQLWFGNDLVVSLAQTPCFNGFL